MTTATAPARVASDGGARLTFVHLLRAEGIALRSLRATTLSLLIGGVAAISVAVGFSVLLATMIRDETGASSGLPSIDAMAVDGILITQIVAVVIGVSAYAKEHATGSLRTQLAAAPRRVALLGAKAAVVALVAFAWSAVVLVLAYAGVAIVYAAFDAGIELSPAQVLVPILGGSALVALSGVLGVGAAALLRSENWALSVVLVFLLILPSVLMTLPFAWAPEVGQLLMGQAGSALHTVPEAITADVVRDILVTVAWPAVVLAAGMAVVRRRDA